jgi:hypothetical protein
MLNNQMKLAIVESKKRLTLRYGNMLERWVVGNLPYNPNLANSMIYYFQLRGFLGTESDIGCGSTSKHAYNQST